MKPTDTIIRSWHKVKRVIFQIPTYRKSALARRKTCFGAHCLGFPFFEIIVIYIYIIFHKEKRPQLSANLP